MFHSPAQGRPALFMLVLSSESPQGFGNEGDGLSVVVIAIPFRPETFFFLVQVVPLATKLPYDPQKGMECPKGPSPCMFPVG